MWGYKWPLNAWKVPYWEDASDESGAFTNIHTLDRHIKQKEYCILEEEFGINSMNSEAWLQLQISVL